MNLYRRTWWSWALYDVANSGFYLVIVATIFQFFYLDLYVQGHAPAGQPLTPEVERELRKQGGSSLAATAAVAMAIVAVLGPILGAASDRVAAKKKFLAVFAGLGASSCALMVFIGPGQVLLASVLYALGAIGAAGSIVFYDALLPSVAREGDLDRISGIGFAAGYGGSVLLLFWNVLWVTNPRGFGLGGPGAAARLSFLSVGVWWALFSIPLLRNVPEPALPGGQPAEGNILLAGFRQLGRTFREAFRYRQLLIFLVGYWIYIDGVGTIIKLAAAFGDMLKFERGHLLAALILTQLVGVPCALGFGWAARRIGAKVGILIGLWVYAAICVGAAFTRAAWHFYALAIGVGLVQGGVQALSRSLFASMTPKAQSAEFFGLFSAMEKFSGIAGPLILALVWAGKGADPRRGILAIAAFFLLGGLVLWRVDVTEGRRAAAGA